METISTYLNSSDNYRRETESLLAFVLNRDLTWVLAHPEYILKTQEKKSLNKCLKRLRLGVPLAYLRRYQDFYNHRFLVTPSVLIPRPESEIIIETGLAYLKEHAHMTFIDLGTGSGALIISLAAEIRRLYPSLYKKSDFMAGDISAAAINIAKRNAKKHRLDTKLLFKRGDLFLPFALKDDDTPIYIAANLPYLTPSEQKSETSIAYEPKLALIGGRDGLTLYRRLLIQLRKSLANRRFKLIMEINPDQKATLVALAKKAFPDAKIQKVPDLTGRTRFISVER